MDKPQQYYARWKKTDTKDNLLDDFIYRKCPPEMFWNGIMVPVGQFCKDDLKWLNCTFKMGKFYDMHKIDNQTIKKNKK